MITYLKANKKYVHILCLLLLLSVKGFYAFEIIFPVTSSGWNNEEVARTFDNPFEVIFTGKSHRENNVFSFYPVGQRLRYTWSIIYFTGLLVVSLSFLLSKRVWSHKWLRFLLLIGLWTSLGYLLNPILYDILESFVLFTDQRISFDRSIVSIITSTGKNAIVPLLHIGALGSLSSLQRPINRSSSVQDLGLLPSRWFRFFHYHSDRLLLLLFGGVLITEVYTNSVFVDYAKNADIMRTLAQLSFTVSITVCYFICEWLFQSTPGKLMMGTSVVRTSGPPSAKNFLIRTLSRLIPFDVFSFMGRIGWHDAVSKTTILIHNPKGTVARIGLLLKITLFAFLVSLVWLVIGIVYFGSDFSRSFDESLWTFPLLLVGILWIVSFLLFAMWICYVAHYLENLVYQKQRKSSLLYAYPYLFLLVPFVNLYVLMSVLNNMDECSFQLQKTMGKKSKFHLTNLISFTGVLFFIFQCLILMVIYDMVTGNRMSGFYFSINISVLCTIVLPMFFHIRAKIMKNINPWIELYEEQGLSPGIDESNSDN